MLKNIVELDYFLLLQLLRERYFLTNNTYILKKLGVKMIDTPKDSNN